MKKEYSDPMIGADIECFLLNKDTYAAVPCVGLFEGTKDNPHQVDGLPDGFWTQEDNVMLEFNVPPAPRWTQMRTNLNTMHQHINIEADKKNLMVHFSNEMLFTPKDLQSPQAQLIGCDPDYNAYEGGKRRTAPSLGTSEWRGAGMHIHFGGVHNCPEFVGALFADLCIMLPLGLNAHPDTYRASWYGQPGIYRAKPYGFEYRSLGSSAWSMRTEVFKRAFKLNNWLISTPAMEIQSTFRAFKRWNELRHCLTSGDQENHELIERAILVGVPM